MKLEMKSKNGLIVAVLGVVVLAVAFWILALSPKREEASELGAKVEQLEASLALHRQEAAEAAAAREEYPANYQQLVVLGKAVPGDDDTASLLVQLNRIANRTGVKFHDIELSAGASSEAPAPAPAPVASSGAPASPTEVAASLLPLGAAVGPAGLAVMPYTLTFDGTFFAVADFISEIDSLVKTKDGEVVVDGRLLTIDGFAVGPATEVGFPSLRVTFSVTSYVTPPIQGVPGEATPEGLAPGTPVATTEGAP